ncbi:MULTISPECIES: M10 family metallopeptidase C-terminal domain-containing protein [Pseudomonas]|uniref:M10 family metallopeptidase C-terminal domain-containing protein n=1 Tax=Pseudomonas TaxID=286 RepID=UPI0006ACED53|nr:MULTISPECIES: M10 family metallopeptidase C-terminal domain-containing protein [Pseudomonas]UEH08863.1 M10 family metallopeptidase C-terminal domain-containing protein [Pseudomonas sp. HN8-3]
MSISRLPPQGSATYQQVEQFRRRDDRGGHIEINGLKSKTAEEATARLISPNPIWKDKNGDGVITITYSFTPGSDKPEGQHDSYQGVTDVSEANKAKTREALKLWEDVTNVKFVEGPRNEQSEGHINFGNFKTRLNDKGQYTPFNPHALPPTKDRLTAHVWTTEKESAGPSGMTTLIHEVGHTLGLKHPGGNYGTKYEQQKLGYVEDSRSHTIMSKYQHGSVAKSPLQDDITAIQTRYGVNHNTRKEDTVYGFNSNANRNFLKLKSDKDELRGTLWDSGGNDTLDLSGYQKNQKINLTPGTFTNANGRDRNLSIARGVIIENAIGGKGNDLIIGNDADNILKGGDGDDIIDGGRGADKLWGGKGADTYVYGSWTESNSVDGTDEIMDFESSKDKVDVSGIRSKIGDAPLRFVDGKSAQMQKGDASISYDPHKNISTLRVFDGQGQPLEVKVHGDLKQSDIVQ